MKDTVFKNIPVVIAFALFTTIFYFLKFPTIICFVNGAILSFYIKYLLVYLDLTKLKKKAKSVVKIHTQIVFFWILSLTVLAALVSLNYVSLQEVTIDDSYYVNLGLLLVISFLIIGNMNKFYVMAFEDGVFFSNFVKNEDIIRFTIECNKKGVPLTITVHHKVGNAVKSRSMTYNKKIEEAIRTHISKKKVGF